MGQNTCYYPGLTFLRCVSGLLNGTAEQSIDSRKNRITIWAMRTMTSKWGGPIPGKPACQGLQCSDCPWFFEMLFMYHPRELRAWERKAQKSFEKHNCAKWNATRAAKDRRPARLL